MEQARIEALGGKHLAGVGDNLMASLSARAERKGYDKPDIAKDDNSFAEAVGLYAREVLTGRKLPESCAGIMAAWRKEIDAKAAPKMEALKDLLDNQQDFGRSVRDLIQDFDLGDDLADPNEDETRMKKHLRMKTTNSQIKHRIPRRKNNKARLKSRMPMRKSCLLYTSPSPRDKRQSRMPSSA